MSTITKETILKYDTPGPRYTSYPTAPEWSTEVKVPVYQDKLQLLGQSAKTLSLYIHIPFCQSLCYFCACNVVIRPKENKYGDEYLQYLFLEIELVRRFLGTKKKVRQLHWGGGTPTFLSEPQIEKLFYKLQKNFDIDPQGEIAIEIDPRTIDRPKLTTLRKLGFNRVSMGIQDFDPTVQKAVHRIQPYATVKDFNNWCRELQFESVNYDLIYGLPHQTSATFDDTMTKILALRPDRIALYSFAYVPWLKKHQNKLAAEVFPTNDAKLDIFLNSRERLLRGGYQAIAMDHFALAADEMAQAYDQGRLHRNFMGYTVKPADEYIGLGVSAIGFLENTYIQNQKNLPDYFRDLDAGELPVERGKVLNLDDQIRQWVINRLMCQFQISKAAFKQRFQEDFDRYFREEQDHLIRCEGEGLLSTSDQTITVTELGRIFIRNVCMGFDWYLRQKNSHRRFSRTV